MNVKEVLDKGYVRVVDVMGSDLSVVNAARVSYDKESSELSTKDYKLLNFLVKEGHTSPFRHAAISFEIYAPLFLARQWWKYAVSSTHVDDQNGWNESSRRYITEEAQFYIPEEDAWRSKPANSKQGSGEPIDPLIGRLYSQELEDYIGRGTSLYEQAMEDGVAPEIARLFLPAYGMYVRWRWTTSLQAVLNFLEQRLEHDAQVEIQLYAQAVEVLLEERFPASMAAFKSYGGKT